MKRHISPAELLCLAVTFAAAAFLALNLAVILIGGIPVLPTALASSEMQFAAGMSLFTSTLSAFIVLAAALPCAYALTRIDFRGRRLLLSLLELPMFLPCLVIGLCLLNVFSSDFGKMLREWGFQVVFNWKGILFAHILVNFPVVIHYLSGIFSACDRELEETALTMGATRLTAFLYIALPMNRRSCLSAFLLAWARGIGEFGAGLMLVGVTRMKTETLPASIYLNLSTGNEEAALAAAVLLLFIAAVVLTAQKLLARSL